MKNKFMRIAAVMLMLCLVTTCAISGTFAKYTTEADGGDKARVAYWGWNEGDASVVLTDLFKGTYSTDVKTSNTDDVIAPGTAGSANFQFIYAPKSAEVKTPEVAYEFVVSTAGSDCAPAIKNNDNIIWKLDGTDVGSFDDLLAAIEALAGSATVTATDGVANYEPSAADLPGISTASHTIAWEWVFHTTDAADEIDTEMGNNTGDLWVEIAITISATQTNA